MKKEIRYDRQTRDFAAYLDDVLVGFYRSYHDAEEALDALAFETLKRAA